MSQRDSGYERKANDLYETPEWVTEALLVHLDIRGMDIWEPAAGSGKIARVLSKYAKKVIQTDIDEGLSFFIFEPLVNQNEFSTRYPRTIGAIITNPPYGKAREFIEHALKLMEPANGVIAMLLRCDYEHASTRAHLFRDCPMFAKKIVLTKRIVWFQTEGKKAAPSYNHAWYIWDYKHKGPPTIAFGP